MSKTKVTKVSQIKRSWHLVNAEGLILGRMATGVAKVLMGKDKPYFAAHMDCGDYVVVINADKVKVTGNKRKQKLYRRHSGYPGGFREISFSDQLKRDSRKVIRHAVSGMLPKNKLRKKMLSRLKVFPGEDYPYQDKFK